MSVDLPSSTEPQVMNRSSDFALMLGEIGIDVCDGELRGPVGGLGGRIHQK